MSQAPQASRTGFAGRIVSFLLLLAVAVIWHNGAGARSQPKPEKGGMVSASIHPDEGLRQTAHHLQKRPEERKSGTLPEPAGLIPDCAPAPRLDPRPCPPLLRQGAQKPSPSYSRSARAPPVTAGLMAVPQA